MMSLSVLTARATVVFSIGSNCGSPWYATSGAFTSFLFDARRLRNLREQHGLGRLLRAGHRREHARARVLERDLLEVLGQRSAWRTSTGPLKSGAENQRPATR